MEKTRIYPAITGLGAVTPYGAGVKRLWENILAGTSAISDLDLFKVDDIPCRRAGVVRSLSMELVARGRAYAFAVTALEEALAMADKAAGAVPRKNTVLVLGTNFGCAGYTDEAFRMAVAQTHGLSPLSISLSLSCASGASVMAQAAELLQEPHIARVVAVGVDELSPTVWGGLCALRTMSARGSVRPFSIMRDGTIFSEGAGAIVFEKDSSSAVARLSGWATGNNGYHMTLPPPRAAGSLAVMQKALAIAGLSPEKIDALIAHATGTKANDITEHDAFADLFGAHLPTVPVFAYKGLLGHLMGAAGIIEAVLGVQMLCTGTLPATDLRDKPDPACDVNLLNATRTQALHRVLLNGAGIGGCNAAVVLSYPEASATAPYTVPDRAVQITGIGTYSAFGLDKAGLERTWEHERKTPSAPGVLGASATPLPDPKLSILGVTAKGYLDPQERLFLAVCGQILKGKELSDCSLMAATSLGPARTRSEFNADFIAKGARLVKPILFPHIYNNSAASLAAIEWTMTGSHLVFCGGMISGALACYTALQAIRRGETGSVCAAAADSSGKLASAAALLLQTGQAEAEAVITGCALSETPEEALALALHDAGIAGKDLKAALYSGARPATLPDDLPGYEPLTLSGAVGASGLLLMIQLAVAMKEEGPVLVSLSENGCVAVIVDRGV